MSSVCGVWVDSGITDYEYEIPVLNMGLDVLVLLLLLSTCLVFVIQASYLEDANS